MIRILFDECGNGHSDIFLKVDSKPTFLQVADTYFLADFLGGQHETKEEIVLAYLNYFKNLVQDLDNEETFVAFDISDEYVGGLLMTKEKKGLIKTAYCWTSEIEGWGVSQNTIGNQVKEHRAGLQGHREWLLGKESILQGLNWSIEKVKTLPRSMPEKS
jgi:hypothetical protein